MTFKKMLISDLISDISMGPFGSNIKVECFVEEGIPVLNGSNLEGIVLNEESFRFVTEEKADSLSKANAHKGDVVITHRGTLGQIIFIPDNAKYDRYVISQSQFRLTCNEKILPEYLVYYFHTRLGQYKLLSNASQVGVPALARPTSTFQKLSIEVPDINSQRKIVYLLESIRKKIEINKAINKNLEEQLNIIYEIFINEYNTKQTTVGDLVTKANTGADAIQKAPIVDYDTGVKCIRIGDMTNNRSFYEWGFTKIENALFNQYQLHKNDIVVTRTASLGLNRLISDDLPAVYNNGLIRLVINSEKIHPQLVYRQFQTKDYRNYISRITDETSVRANMKINYLLSYSFMVLEKKDQDELLNVLTPLFNYQEKIISQNYTLSLIRDSLLTRLMSGEIDVSNLEL